jgi:hypothetical protein
MRLFYLTTDELNTALVRDWCGRKGIAVECHGLADNATPGPQDAVLIDGDHPPAGQLERLLRKLGNDGEFSPAIAAHGYGGSCDRLRRPGVTVNRRLRARLLKEIMLAAMAREYAMTHDTSEDRTWINLD